LAGYNWKESLRKEHELNVLDFNYVQPIKVTDQYRMLAESDATLKKAIEDQFTIGSSYKYTFTNTEQTNKKHTIYQLVGIDLSGNILGLVTGANVKEGKVSKLFGAPFSQYIKLEQDFRYYLKLSEDARLASRLFTGVGYAYGNSVNLPFVKQFFVGGGNSIRAFKARTVGPGTYYAPDDPKTESGFTADQSGDIKLEMNVEYRKRLIGILHGAVFADAGNIWLINNDLDPEARKEGALFNNHFMRELLVGAGAGLRLDLSFVILRLDLAFPLRKPWLPEGERWVVKDIRFGSPTWRKENLVWNLAIGYPF
jgi:outer membrane protein assembly factor BamA